MLNCRPLQKAFEMERYDLHPGSKSPPKLPSWEDAVLFSGPKPFCTSNWWLWDRGPFSSEVHSAFGLLSVQMWRPEGRVRQGTLLFPLRGTSFPARGRSNTRFFGGRSLFFYVRFYLALSSHSQGLGRGQTLT